MNRKNLLKRTVAWLVAMVMVISMLPMGLVAAQENNPGEATFDPPMFFTIRHSEPVLFEGPARVAWGDIIGFLDDGDPPGAVTFTVNVPVAGTYRMHVNHRTFAGAASHEYRINGGEPIIFHYPETVAEYSLFPEEIELNAGANTIRIAFHSGIT
ncbi:MAG: hypothetical protein FWC32_00225, partial [Firmicutes bacterium]|nr:hypothetical protein [Bacillota bacterium]